MNSETMISILLSILSLLAGTLIAIGISRHFAKKSSGELKTEIKKIESLNNKTLRLIELINNNPNITLQRDAKGRVTGITISTNGITESLDGGIGLVGLSHNSEHESSTSNTDP